MAENQPTSLEMEEDQNQVIYQPAAVKEELGKVKNNREKLTETEAKLLHQFVDQERLITKLKSELIEERKEKLETQQNFMVFKGMGLQMVNGLTEIVEDLVGDLLKEEEDGQGQHDGDSDAGMEVLRNRIPMALNILKKRIQGLTFNQEDKQMLEDLRKMINIFIATKKSVPEAGNLFNDDDGPRSSTPVVKYVLVDYNSELGDPSSILDQPEVPPIQPSVPIPIPMQVDPDSDSDDDVVFLEEVEVPCEDPSPRIIATYSVQPIRGQFTPSSSTTQPGSKNEPSGEAEEDIDEIPSTSMASQAKETPRRQVAMKRTGGFVPKIVIEEDPEKCQGRRSPRSKTNSRMEKTVKIEGNAKMIHAIHPDNPGHCLCGFMSSAANVESHLKLLSGGGQGQPKIEKVEDQQHYLVDTPKRSKGYQCVCGSNFNLKRLLTAHVRSQTEGGLKFKCDLCKTRFFYYSGLRVHLKSAHKVVMSPETERLHGCSFCGKTYPSIEKLCQHRFSAHSGMGETDEMGD